MVEYKISSHLFCRSDLRIATKHNDSRESEFPPTVQSVQVILKSTITNLLKGVYHEKSFCISHDYWYAHRYCGA